VTAEVLKAALIGIIQALTEFLPVSSSGHMVVAKVLLGVEEVGITMEVVTHLATALAVIIYLRRRIGEILVAILRYLARRSEADERAREGLRLFIWVVIGSIPAAIAGLLLREQLGAFFGSARIASAMLIVTGVFVLLSGKLARSGRGLGPLRAVIIGIAQAFAILPGISRSGVTVGSGLLVGIDRRKAFEFSLLLSLPAILGGTVLELLSGRMGGSLAVIAAAMIPAFVVGYVAIKLLFRAVVRNWFHAFGYYLIPLGILLLILL
jgi:undecaprenyl-diphosphatase